MCWTKTLTPTNTERSYAAAVLPNGRLLTPVGVEVPLDAPKPYGLALSPDGTTLATINSGASRFSISLIRNLDSSTPSTTRINVNATFMGVTFSSNGSHFFASGGENGNIWVGETAANRIIGSVDLNAAAHLDLLKKTVLFGDEDVKYLRMSRAVLQDQIAEVLEVWYGFVGANPHLLVSFTNRSDCQPNTAYPEAVRGRFGQWILDTADTNYDQQWLDYQFEIGRRHHRSGKNRTDHVDAAEHISYRYLPALIVPITTTLRPFLAKKGHSAEDVEKMHAAWVKSVVLQVTLWSYPYCKDGDF